MNNGDAVFGGYGSFQSLNTQQEVTEGLVEHLISTHLSEFEMFCGRWVYSSYSIPISSVIDVIENSHPKCFCIVLEKSLLHFQVQKILTPYFSTEGFHGDKVYTK